MRTERPKILTRILEMHQISPLCRSSYTGNLKFGVQYCKKAGLSQSRSPGATPGYYVGYSVRNLVVQRHMSGAVKHDFQPDIGLYLPKLIF